MKIKNKAIKLVALAFCIVLLITSLAPSISGYETDIPCTNEDKADAIYLFNIESNHVYFQKNADSSRAPASTVKLMTALVAYDCIADLSATVTVSNAAASYTDMNVMSLKAGERLSAADLMRAMLCSGYNDAAAALAIFSCGSLNSFVEKMNQKATSLGANNTTYKDPSGLDDSASTTAKDTFLIAKAFFENKELLEISSTASFVIPSTNLSPERRIYNRNALISGYTGTKYLNANAMGMNAGMTDIGGYCLATAAQKDGMTYICIVMGAKYDPTTETVYSYAIANDLINYVTRSMGARIILNQNDVISSLPVKGGNINNNTVDIVPEGDIVAHLPADYINDEKFKILYIIEKDELKAPVEAGEKVGMVIVSYGSNIVGVHDLVTAKAIEKDTFISILESIRQFLFSRFFISTAFCFAVMMFIYAFVRPTVLRKRHKKAKKYRYQPYR